MGSQIATWLQNVLQGPVLTGEIYTRNEWRRCKNTLETSVEDVKTHSKRVEKIGSLGKNSHSQSIIELIDLLTVEKASLPNTGTR